MDLCLIAVVAYLIGSIPFSLLLARLVGGIDLRQHGSGNIGATNVARTLGWRWGSLALLLDALKGAIPVGVIPATLAHWDHSSPHAAPVAALFAIVGHMFPCWLKFRGGKGVATGLGAVSVLSPSASLVAALMFALIFAVKRIVSIGSIFAAIAFAVAQIFLHRADLFGSETWSLTAFSIGVPLLIIVRHAANIRRLFSGTEKPLVVSSETTQSPVP